MSTKQQLTEAMKAAMRSQEKQRLGAVRLILANVKQFEVDKRLDATDEVILKILDKMQKQRRDSLKMFQDAGRDELAAQEQFELDLIHEFLPQQLSTAEVKQLIEQAIAKTGASSMRDMGKVMGILKTQLQGKTDMAEVSGVLKDLLV